MMKHTFYRRAKKAYEIDPLECPNRQKEMKIISCIDWSDLIYKILKHLILLGKGFGADDEA
jgi:hypothetical protein